MGIHYIYHQTVKIRDHRNNERIAMTVHNTIQILAFLTCIQTNGNAFLGTWVKLNSVISENLNDAESDHFSVSIWLNAFLIILHIFIFKMKVIQQTLIQTNKINNQECWTTVSTKWLRASNKQSQSGITSKLRLKFWKKWNWNYSQLTTFILLS